MNRSFSQQQEEQQKEHPDAELNRRSIRGVLQDTQLVDKIDAKKMVIFKCHEFCLQIKYEINMVKFCYNISLLQSSRTFLEELRSAIKDLEGMGKLKKKEIPKETFF